MITKAALTEQELQACAERLGGAMRTGTVELIGDVGAGKTTFTKGFARGLGVTDDVQSPTFTLSRIYDARDGLRLAHYDFYRLHDPGVMAIELDEAVHDPMVISVIEWGDIVADVLPDNRLTITLTAADELHRDMTIDSKSEQLLDVARGALA